MGTSIQPISLDSLDLRYLKTKLSRKKLYEEISLKFRQSIPTRDELSETHSLKCFLAGIDSSSEKNLSQ